MTHPHAQTTHKPRVVRVTNHEPKRMPRPGSANSPFKLVAVYDPEGKSGVRAKHAQTTPAHAQPVKPDPEWVATLKGLITKRW